MEDLLEQQIWLLVRQELTLADFEQWVYANNAIEDVIGWKAHLELISADFTDRDIILNCFEEWFQQKYPNTISLKLQSEIADIALSFIKGPEEPQLTLDCCDRFTWLEDTETYYDDEDDDFMAFFVIESEVVGLVPFSKENKPWFKLSLFKERKVYRWHNWARPMLLKASNNLLNRFAHPPKE